MLNRFGSWLLVPLHQPKRAAAVALILGLAAFPCWLGIRALWFRNERTAAVAALAAYDFPEARRRLERCLELRPDDADVHLLAAQAARRDEDLEAAQIHLDRYLDLAGTTPEGTLAAAILKARRGQVLGVVDFLMSRLDIRHPDSEQILEALMEGSLEIYLLDKAGFWGLELLERYPRNPLGQVVRGRLTEAMGDREQTLRLFRELVEEYPRHKKARLQLAGQLFRVHSYQEAAAHYEELIRQQPGEAAAALGLARCWIQLNRLDEARPLIGKLEAEHADQADVMLECGKFAFSEDRFADAERLLRRAVQLAPHNHDAHYRLGVCLEQLGQAAESRLHLRRSDDINRALTEVEKLVEVVGKAPSDPAPRVQAARVCMRVGQENEAFRWLQGALAIAPQDAGAQAALKEYYDRRGAAATDK